MPPMVWGRVSLQGRLQFLLYLPHPHPLATLLACLIILQGKSFNCSDSSPRRAMQVSHCSVIFYKRLFTGWEVIPWAPDVKTGISPNSTIYLATVSSPLPCGRGQNGLEMSKIDECCEIDHASFSGQKLLSYSGHPLCILNFYSQGSTTFPPGNKTRRF